ncbi:hypothetical protein Y048_4554 [Burkholderia pseudomallei MSHR456]|nr:hypothetical protein Y048_4554 [Burkholderia pseudomallei MSHR456]
MSQTRCRNSGNSLWATTRYCPVSCIEQPGARTNSKSNDGLREVSGLLLFLFGFVYLYYKGWYKSALVHALLCFSLMGTFWIAIPFYATKFVNFCEEL